MKKTYFKQKNMTYYFINNNNKIFQKSNYLDLIEFLVSVLYIDLRHSQTSHSKVMHWKEVTRSSGSYEEKLHRWIWLMKWDKVKAHDTLIDWCTGREWPLNCMTVFSTWWRSNMPFQRLSGRSNYYITRLRQEVRSWRSDELETRGGRESHHPAEGALGTPNGVGDQRSRRQDVVEKATTRQREHSGPQIELEIRWVGDKMR